MPSIKWHHVWGQPVGSLKIIALATFSSVREILVRLVLPFQKRTLPLRNALARIWLGTSFAVNPSVFYSAPLDDTVQHVEENNLDFYIVPSLKDPATQLRDADAVVLFAHGGGMIMGHPLQYLDEYRRWVQRAKELGRNVVFIAVKYPLSIAEKWPAQRASLLGVYRWILDQGVPATKVALAGDSAGGNLVLLTLMHIRDSSEKIPLPASVVLISPWVDMSAAQTADSPNFDFDFMFQYKEGVPIMNNSLRPKDLPFDTPEISAVLAENVGGLPPQLVFYSPTELLASDSERWIERSRKAGVNVAVHNPPGEMHTFAVGWPVSGAAVSQESDNLFLQFVLTHVASP